MKAQQNEVWDALCRLSKQERFVEFCVWVSDASEDELRLVLIEVLSADDMVNWNSKVKRLRL